MHLQAGALTRGTVLAPQLIRERIGGDRRPTREQEQQQGCALTLASRGGRTPVERDLDRPEHSALDNHGHRPLAPSVVDTRAHRKGRALASGWRGVGGARHGAR